MIVAPPSPRPAARSRGAAAYALAALTFVLAFLGATSDRWAPAHVASVGVPTLRASVARIARSTANEADPARRGPRARLVSDGADEKATLGGRAPTPTSAVRSRGDSGWDGRLPGSFRLEPVARCLAPNATAALVDVASGARIAALHQQAFETIPPREPNPARGPPPA